MIRVSVGRESAYLVCHQCPDWWHDIEDDPEEANVRRLHDVALRHEASVEHLLRVMGSVS